MTFAALLLLLAPAPLPAAEVAKSSRTLVVCDDVEEPLTLDPHKQFAEKNHTLLQQMYEGLVRFAPDGRIEPSLAVSWKRLGPLQVRFRLREGVSFHDGEPFTAEAVRFSIARYLNPKTGFPALGFISSIERAEVVDDRTVDIWTKYPDGLLLNRLAGFVLIVPPRYIKREGEAVLLSKPNGTGPFRYLRWEHMKAIWMERHLGHWDTRPSSAERLVFKFLPIEDQLAALKRGDIDISTEFPGTQTTNAVRAGIRIVKAPTFYTVTGSLNSEAKPLSDLRVRRALNYAINKADLIRYDLFGNGLSLATVTMPGEEGHNPNLKPYPYDIEKARSLLAEAGYASGFVLKAVVKKQGERAARVIAKQWEAIGVRMNMTLVTDADVVQTLMGGKWDVFIAGCPDPMAHSYFIQSIYLYGKSPYRVAVNTEYDALLERMVGALDDAERARLGRELDAYIHENALLLFMYQRLKTYGLSPRVSFTPSVTGMPHFYAAGKESP